MQVMDYLNKQSTSIIYNSSYDVILLEIPVFALIEQEATRIIKPRKMRWVVQVEYKGMVVVYVEFGQKTLKKEKVWKT